MSRHTFPHLLARLDAVNVAYTVERCHVLGPGQRFIVWVQGCPLRCQGCHNPQFIPFRDAEWTSVNELAHRVAVVERIEGVTYVGGEPFAQAEALAALSHRLRSEGMTVMAYSGFTLGELQRNVVPHAADLLGEIDLLLDGRYCHDKPTNKPWRGSDNQRLIALSPRYREFIPIWNTPIGQEFEVRVSENGEVEFLGISPTGGKEPGHTYTGSAAKKGGESWTF